MWTLDRPHPSGASRWGGHSSPALSRLPLWSAVPRSSGLCGVLWGGPSLTQLPALFPGTVVASLLQTMKAPSYRDLVCKRLVPSPEGPGLWEPWQPLCSPPPWEGSGSAVQGRSCCSSGPSHSGTPRAVGSASGDCMLDSTTGSRETGTRPRGTFGSVTEWQYPACCSPRRVCWRGWTTA